MFELIRSELVGGRVDLAGLCNVLGLKTAVEVGTDRGIFAADFLSRWNGDMLYCVDSWQPYPEMPWDRAGDLALAVTVLAPYARKVRLILADSREVVKWFGVVDGFPTSIDFAYIDAAHTYEEAKSDIEAWWPVVRHGGVLAGDDFDSLHPGVMRALEEFARYADLPVRLTTDYNRGPSWYMEKPPLPPVEVKGPAK